MPQQTFSCPPTEWHYSRAYSFIAITDTQGLNSDSSKSWMIAPIMLLLLCGIGSNIHMHGLWLIGIFGSFPWFIIRYLRNNNQAYSKLQSKFRFAKGTEVSIPYLSVDDRYLYCHFYSPDRSISHQIPLKSIHSIAMRTMSNSTRTLKLPALINELARRTGNETVPETFRDPQTFQLWIYTRSFFMHRSAITIPPSWFHNDTFASCITEIERKSGIQLHLSRSN